jgi:putative addiction module killer protein
MTRGVEPKTVLVYQDTNGREPFTAWLNSLRDQKGRRIILQRIGRLEQGLYGDCESVGEGVLELRIFFGPGYRVYFGEEANQLVILLIGGDKGTQTRDIKTAKAYWKEYQTHGKA